MAKQLAIKKLENNNGENFYPLSTPECIVTTRDFSADSNVGGIKKGTVIPKYTNLNTILTQLFKIGGSELPVYTNSDVFQVLNDYTAFEVYANDEVISAGTVDPITQMEYKVDVPVQMTELFSVRSAQPLNKQNVIIDWGDGSITALKDETSADSEDAIATTDGGVYEFTDEDREYEHFCWHKYQTAGRYIVKIYGNTYWGIRNKTRSQYNLICRLFDTDLPLAKCCVNISHIGYQALRLQKIAPQPYFDMTFVENMSLSFTNCTNLLVVKNFAKLPIMHQPVAICELFRGCSNLTTSDMRLHPSAARSRSNWYSLYEGCSNLQVDVLDLLPANGFQGKYVLAPRIFMGCAKLTCSNYDRLANILWDDGHIIWDNPQQVFTGCTSMDLTKIPTRWGGSKQN